MKSADQEPDEREPQLARVGHRLVIDEHLCRVEASHDVKEIAEASRTGSATNMIIGTAVGFETTAVTAITVGLALVASFVLGQQADIENVSTISTGVFGTAVATMGMLIGFQ